MATTGTTSETATITPVNGSTVHGTATLTAQGNGQFTLDISLAGLAPYSQVPMDLQGFFGSRPPTLPTAAADADHDGQIDFNEATTTLGPPVLTLSLGQNIWMNDPQADMPALPTADAAGAVHYHETFGLAPGATAVQVSSFAQSLESAALGVYRGGLETTQTLQAAGVFEPAGATAQSGSEAALHQLTLLG